MAKASPGAAFSEAADKVVSMSELRKKTKAIYKAELSVGEKIYLNVVDKPASLLVGSVIAIKNAIKGTKPEGGYVDDSNFPPKMYISGAFMAATLDSNPPLTPKWDAKLIEMTKRAFDQCEDVSKTPKMQALKPI